MAIPQHIRLEFVTPERAIAKDDVDEVQLPGLDGFFGVLPGHAPLLAALQPGEMWFRKGTHKEYAFLGGGFAEVVGDRVSILAPVAEKAGDIDLARAEAAKRRAEERLAAPKSDMDFERARIALIRAISRLDAAKRAQVRSRS
jgi:F-type H+-transporting ATPase subunit epsilon